jgi:hypothetical protein
MNSIKKMLSDAVLIEQAELLAEFTRAAGARLAVLREELEARTSFLRRLDQARAVEQAVCPLKRRTARCGDTTFETLDWPL